MPWTVIPNLRGQNRAATDAVTVSWRSQGKGAKTAEGLPKMRLGLYIHRHMTGKLGIAPKKGEKPGKFRVEYDAETNRLRLAPLARMGLTKAGEQDGFTPSVKDGTLGFYIPLDHIRRDTTVRPARPVAAESVEGWLIVCLPEWAQHPGAAAARASADAVRRKAAA